MPRGDRTGPNGDGPKTGRGMGDCSGNVRTGYFRDGFGRGYRGRPGRGAGRGYGFYSGYSQSDPAVDVSRKTLIENEIRVLKDQLNSLEKELEGTQDK